MVVDGTLYDEKQKQTWMQEENQKKQEQEQDLERSREKFLHQQDEEYGLNLQNKEQRKYSNVKTIAKRDVKIKPFFLGKDPWIGGEASNKKKQKKYRKKYRDKITATKGDVEKKRDTNEALMKKEVAKSMKATVPEAAKAVIVMIDKYYSTLTDVNTIRSMNAGNMEVTQMNRMTQYYKNSAYISDIVKLLKDPSLQQVEELDKYRNVFFKMTSTSLKKQEIDAAPEKQRVDTTNRTFTHYELKKTVVTKKDGTPMTDQKELDKKRKELNKKGLTIQYDADNKNYYYMERDVAKPKGNFDLMDRKNEVLFPREITTHDIAQGAVGDCYFLTALQSIVEKNPEKIKESMCDEGDTVTVRFYQMKDGIATPVYIKVTKEVSQNYAIGALWVQIMEKAYTVYRSLYDEKRKYTTRKGTDAFDYGVLNAGNAHIAMGHILGQTFETQGKTVASVNDLENLGSTMPPFVSETNKAYIEARKAYNARNDELDSLEEELKEKDPRIRALVKDYDDYTDKNWDKLDEKKYPDIYKERQRLEEEVQKAIAAHPRYITKKAETDAAAKKMDDLYNSSDYCYTESTISVDYLGQIYMTRGELEKVFGKHNNIGGISNAMITSVEQIISGSLVGMAKTMNSENKAAADFQKRFTMKEMKHFMGLVEGKAKELFNINQQAICGRVEKMGVKMDKAIEDGIMALMKSTIERTLQRMNDNINTSGNYHEEAFSGEYTDKDKADFEKISRLLTDKTKLGLVTVGTDGSMKVDNTQKGFNGEKMANGMVLGHAYSIVDTKVEGKLLYVKVRNPWGCGIPSYDTDKNGNLRVTQDYTSKTNGEAWKEWNDLLNDTSVLMIGETPLSA